MGSRTANVGRVSVSMVAETAQYVTKLQAAQDKTQKELEKLKKNFSSASKNVKKESDAIAKAFDKIGAAAKGMGAGYVVAELGKMAIAQARAVRESINLARQMNTSIQQYRAVEYAAAQYGMTGENVSDITKDMTDKIREFARDGTGQFTDFATELGLTAEEAQTLANELVELSGPEQMARVIKELESAGLTTREMTQATESLGNNFSRIIPLFRNGASEMNRLTGEYEAHTREIDTESIEVYRRFNEQIDLLAASFKSLMENVLVPVMKVVGNVAEEFAMMFAMMNGNEIAEVNLSIKRSTEYLENLQEQIAEGGPNTHPKMLEAVEKTKQRIKDLQKEMDILTGKELRTQITDINSQSNATPRKGSGDAVVVDPKEPTAAITPKDQARLDREKAAALKRAMNELAAISTEAGATEIARLQAQQKEELRIFDQKYKEEYGSTDEYAKARQALLIKHARDSAEQLRLDGAEKLKISEEHIKQFNELSVMAAAEGIDRIRAQNRVELMEFDAKYDEQLRMTDEYALARLNLIAKHDKMLIEQERETANKISELKAYAASNDIEKQKITNAQQLAEFDAKFSGELSKTEEYYLARANLISQGEETLKEIIEAKQAEVDALMTSLNIGYVNEISTQYLAEQELLDKSLEQKLISQENYEKAKIALTRQYAGDLLQAQMNADAYYLQAASDTFGQMNAAFKQVGEEGSAIAKGLFLAQQAAAIASAVVATEQAATKALADPAFTTAERTINANLIRVQGYAGVAAIGAQTIAGFEVGHDELPSDMIAQIHEGERIIPKKSNKDLMAMMEDVDKFIDGGIEEQMEQTTDDNYSPSQQPIHQPEGAGSQPSTSGTVINAPMTISGNVTDEKWFDEKLVKHRNVIAACYEKVSKERPKRK